MINRSNLTATKSIFGHLVDGLYLRSPSEDLDWEGLELNGEMPTYLVDGLEDSLARNRQAEAERRERDFYRAEDLSTPYSKPVAVGMDIRKNGRPADTIDLRGIGHNLRVKKSAANPLSARFEKLNTGEDFLSLSSKNLSPFSIHRLGEDS